MKKYLSVVTATILSLSISGCGNNGTNGTNGINAGWNDPKIVDTFLFS